VGNIGKKFPPPEIRLKNLCKSKSGKHEPFYRQVRASLEELYDY